MDKWQINGEERVNESTPNNTVTSAPQQSTLRFRRTPEGEFRLEAIGSHGIVAGVAIIAMLLLVLYFTAFH
ncbi:MAG: hypothetical protein ABJO09_00085 [Hyphomicrobiales bacterium]|uniref:hypothetical protein n=1 Tax=Litoreibacter sp. TaxID=1969459 RepID=UPI003298E5EE